MEQDRDDEMWNDISSDGTEVEIGGDVGNAGSPRTDWTAARVDL